MYEDLVAALNTLTDVAFAEYGWSTRPATDFGVISLGADGNALIGDNEHIERARECYVDLFTHGKGDDIAEDVEEILETVCESGWSLNSVQYEHETGLLHREYICSLEG